MTELDEEEHLLMEELLTIIEEYEDCFGCIEGNGDCDLQESESHLLET
jgi:hypothetical protein